MKRTHFLLGAGLLLQFGLLIWLLDARSTRPETAPKDGAARAAEVAGEAAIEVARAAELLHQIETGRLDPFAPRKPSGGAARRTRRTAPSATAYDRMLATTEGGLLVRADVADRIEEAYANVLDALRLDGSEKEQVKTILVDLEMVKADIRSTHGDGMTSAEFGTVFQSAAEDDIARLKQVLGPERYAIAQTAYGRTRLDQTIRRVVEECTALGVPLDNAIRPKLLETWSRSASWPKDLAVGSPLARDGNLTVTNWDQLLQETKGFLNNMQWQCLQKSAATGW